MNIKSISISVAILVLSLIIASYDVFNLDANGSNSVSAVKVLYMIPFFLYIVFSITKTHYSRRSVTASEEKTEKIKSLIRSIIQIIGTLITFAGAFNVKIPFIDILRTVLSYVADNVDIATNAILALVGIGITIYGFFKNGERFQDRSTKIEGKELIQ